MSTRPASPPPVTRWPFVLGAALATGVGAVVFLLGESPPGLGAMLLLIVCIITAIALVLMPYVMEYDARVRIAESQGRDQIEAQLRRLTQTAEQLGNAVSRSQSTEEQAGQALGTIEEVSEKLGAQADELAQSLARSQEREVSTLKAEIERLAHERDDRFAALDQRLDTVTGQLSEHQLAARKTSSAAHRAMDELKDRLAAMQASLDEIVHGKRRGAESASTSESNATASPAFSPAASTSAPARSTPVSSEPATIPTTTSSSTESAAAPAPGPASEQPLPHPPTAKESKSPAVATTVEAATATITVTPSPAPAPKPRARRTAEQPATASASAAASRLAMKSEPLDLPLDLGESRPLVHRETSTSEGGGSTSTLVATAYIGIGNKLYVRGDGPGLNWNQGVPMQFLAIGKWGWTSPEAAEPITCRIYRNDDTPMLDENIVIAPGTKAEVTPRF